MSIGIYEITSPTGRVYIGQSVNIEARFISYRKIKCTQQRRLYNSIIKYGYENHKFEIIELCSIISLNTKERYYQDLYNVLSKGGLNCVLTKTTDKSGKQSKSTIAIRIKVSTGKKRHPSFGAERNNKIKSGQIICTKGEKYSEESKAKMRANNKRAMLGRSHSDKYKRDIIDRLSKPILDTYTGVYYKNASELSEIYNIKPNLIRSRLNGTLKNNTRFIYA